MNNLDIFTKAAENSIKTFTHNTFVELCEKQVARQKEVCLDKDLPVWVLFIEEAANRIKRLSIAEGSNIKVFEIWMEGYNITGEHAKAQKLGKASGTTFEQACQYFMHNASSVSRINYNPEDNSYWACRLFDNEVDARKSFG